MTRSWNWALLVFHISQVTYIFKNSQDQGLRFLPEYLNKYHVQYYKGEVAFESGKVFYIFWCKEVNLIALIKAKYKLQQSINNLNFNRKAFDHVGWDFFWKSWRNLTPQYCQLLNFSLYGDNIQCSNRLTFREKETDLVGFVGIVMIKLQTLWYIQKDSEKEFFYSIF